MNLTTTAGLAAVATVLSLLAGCGDSETSASDAATTLARGTATQPSSQGERTVTIDAVEKDGAASGTIDVSSAAGSTWSIDVECSTELEGALVVGGTTSRSDGYRAAVILKQGSPDQMVLWFEDPPAAADCPSFMKAIPAGVASSLFPVDEGDFTTE